MGWRQGSKGGERWREGGRGRDEGGQRGDRGERDRLGVRGVIITHFNRFQLFLGGWGLKVFKWGHLFANSVLRCSWGSTASIIRGLVGVRM